MIKHALEGGINLFDTANSYSAGSSEEIVGRALRDFARREDVVVATKVFHQVDDLAEDYPAHKSALNPRQPQTSGYGLCRHPANSPLGLQHTY
ncbi:aldo/keto reductase [Shigella flexneri]